MISRLCYTRTQQRLTLRRDSILSAARERSKYSRAGLVAISQELWLRPDEERPVVGSLAERGKDSIFRRTMQASRQGKDDYGHER